MDGHDEFDSKINVLSAENFDGKATLVGNASSNSIIAGQDDSSLWGGNGGNNTLIGGDGDDEFFYFNNGNNDVVSGADDDEVVNLFGMDISEITGIEVENNAISMNFSNGGSLTVDGDADVTFKVNSNGVSQNWKVDRSSGEWSTTN